MQGVFEVLTISVIHTDIEDCSEIAKEILGSELTYKVQRFGKSRFVGHRTPSDVVEAFNRWFKDESADTGMRFEILHRECKNLSGLPVSLGNRKKHSKDMKAYFSEANR